MKTDYLAGLPHFSIGAIKFRAWVTDNGHRYEWRSTCGRYRAGNRRGRAWAWACGRLVGEGFETLRSAMLKATTAQPQARAA